MIMPNPIAHNTSSTTTWYRGSKVNRKEMISISERINHTPLFKRNKLNSFLDLLCPARKTDTPLKKAKVGAQKCVTQRVKNKITVVLCMFTGDGPGTCKKSRQ